MSSQELKYICRICLDPNVILDWNKTVYRFCDITYKDCFYKYTQLEPIELDTFSSMICQSCVNGLYNVHVLILKALESHKYFQRKILIADHTKHLKDDVLYTAAEFETVYVEGTEDDFIIDDYSAYEHPYEESILKPVKTKAKKSKRSKYINAISVKQEKYEKNENSIKLEENTIDRVIVSGIYLYQKNSEHILPPSKECSKKSQRKIEGKLMKVINKDNIDEKLKIGNKITSNQNKRIRILESELLSGRIKDSRAKANASIKHKELKTPKMCSICSKILRSNYAVQMHEKTHLNNRERKETCNICGVKFYDKRSLQWHSSVHNENREKNQKCEFCDKAFYNKGDLNVHRRIHLGQMIPCSLCSKQFFRKNELKMHMNSHSATSINSETKKRSKYMVRCKHCNKSILSTSFKSHTAAHLKEPLMKCSVCDKDFFRRTSCVLHIKKVHQKTNEEYNDFIFEYKKNRISHLFLEQQADIKSMHK